MLKLPDDALLIAALRERLEEYCNYIEVLDNSIRATDNIEHQRYLGALASLAQMKTLILGTLLEDRSVDLRDIVIAIAKLLRDGEQHHESATAPLFCALAWLSIEQKIPKNTDELPIY